MESQINQLGNKLEVNPETVRKFLEFGLERADMQKIAHDVSELKKAYESPLERVKLLIKNPIYILQNGNLVVPYWQATGLRPEGGSCVDIAEELRFKWDYQGFIDKLNSKGLNLLLCVGQEPGFFPRKTDNHIFLSIAKPTKPRGASFSGNDMIVVDPAFQKVDTMVNSKYGITNIASEQVHITNNLNHTLKPYIYYKERRHSIPTTSENRLVLSMDPKRQYLLNFTVIKNGESYMPAIEIMDTNNQRKVVFWDKSDSTVVNPKINMSPPLDQQTDTLLEDMAKRLTGVKFVKASYNNNGQPIDNSGVELNFVTSHFASGVSYQEPA